MIFDMHGKAFYRWIKRRAFRNGPGEKGTAKFEAKIVVEVGSAVFLYDTNQG
jgi:hypothetical protein